MNNKACLLRTHFGSIVRTLADVAPQCAMNWHASIQKIILDGFTDLFQLLEHLPPQSGDG